LWAVKREELRRSLVSSVGVFEVVFLIIVFLVGVIGFIKAATKDD
jgi:hypothetical protein